MKEEEKQAFQEEILSNVKDQFYGIVLESQKPLYKALRMRLVNLLATLLTLGIVALIGVWGAGQINQIKNLFQTPDQIKKTAETLATQIKEAKRNNVDTYETKLSHIKDTEEIKELVKKGEGERVQMFNVLNKQQVQLEGHGQQLTNITTSLQSLQNAINLRNVRSPQE